MNTNAAAWSFVLQYSKEIENITSKIFRKIVDDQDYGDIRQDFILRIVSRYPQLADYCDCNEIHDKRGLAIYWLKMQGMAARTTMNKRRGKFRNEIPASIYKTHNGTLTTIEDLGRHPEAGPGTEIQSTEEGLEAASEREYAGAIVGALWNKATPEERLAMASILKDMARDELEEQIGMTPRARNRVLRSLQPTVLAMAA